MIIQSHNKAYIKSESARRNQERSVVTKQFCDFLTINLDRSQFTVFALLQGHI